MKLADVDFSQYEAEGPERITYFLEAAALAAGLEYNECWDEFQEPENWEFVEWKYFLSYFDEFEECTSYGLYIISNACMRLHGRPFADIQKFCLWAGMAE